MSVIKIDPSNPDKNKIAAAAKVIRDGGLVVFPTETVYGIAANLLDGNAMDRLYRVKARPEGKPFTVHISDLKMVRDMGCAITGTAEKLMAAFWPGPLTIILKSHKGEKIGFRMPADKTALELIRLSGVPVAAPSANLSGKPAPATAEEAMTDLEGKIDMVIDGGRTGIGIESTVVDMTVTPPKILREGAIGSKDISKIIMHGIESILFVCTGNSCRSIMAEGLMKYALKGLGKEGIKVSSAGVSAIDGFHPTRETIEAMKREGVDVSGLQSRSLTDEMIRDPDLILVMAAHHMDDIIKRVPRAASKTHILKEYGYSGDSAACGELDIPDPIGKSMEVYEHTLGEIKSEINRIAELL